MRFVAAWEKGDERLDRRHNSSRAVTEKAWPILTHWWNGRMAPFWQMRSALMTGDKSSLMRATVIR